MVTILTKATKEKKKLPFISLRWIMLAGYLVGGIVPLLLLASTILHSVQGYFLDERKKVLLSQANVISGQVTSSEFLFDEENRSALEETILETSQEKNFRVMILDSSCLVTYDTGYEDVGKTLLLPEVVQALQHKDTAKEQKNGTVYAAASIVGAGDTRVGVVLIVDSLADVHDILGDIGKEAYLLLGTLVLLVLIVMVIISKVFTEPVKNLIDVIRKMSEGHFEQRAKVRGIVHNEIVDLAISCNQMADQLEKVESSRQQFVSNVSHELKTPLAAISGYSELIENGMVSEKDIARFGGEIHKSADRLLTLINDTIRLSELDATTQDVVLETVDLYQAAENCMDTLEMSAKKHDVILKLEGESCKIRTEKGMADEVIYNLCDNAIRYNNKGGSVTISVMPVDNQIVLSVKDTGIGISKEHQERIFERFYRVDKSRSKSTGGTGLGLAIVKHIVARNGARMELASEVGKGTEIRIYFDKAA